MSEKSFLMILGPIWSKIVFWQKQISQICPKILKIPDFFNFPKSKNGRKWPKLADNYFKTSAFPQSLSKIFFVSQTQKSMKIFEKNHPPPSQKKRPFFGGGGGVMILMSFSPGLTQHEKKQVAKRDEGKKSFLFLQKQEKKRLIICFYKNCWKKKRNKKCRKWGENFYSRTKGWPKSSRSPK